MAVHAIEKRSSRWLLCTVGWGVLLLACACGGKVRRDTHLETKHTTTVRESRARTPSPSLPKLVRLPESKIRDASQSFILLRGWPELPPTPAFVAEPAALLHALRAEQDLEMEPEQRRAQSVGLSMLGLIPEGLDWDSVMLEALVDNLSGVYLTTTKSILLRAQLSDAAIWVTLRHELMHAIQDHLYAIGKKVLYADLRGDAIAAVHTLAEGEALALELELDAPLTSTDPDLVRQLKAHLEKSLAEAGDLAPILRRALIAPYVDGLRVVSALRRRGGWEAVEELWQKGPKSTAELLCEIRGDCRETPTWFDSPLPSAVEGRTLLSDVMGEQGLRLVLEETGEGVNAETLAASWGGDRLRLRQAEHTLWLVWHIRLKMLDPDRRVGEMLARALKLGVGWTGADACLPVSAGQLRAIATSAHDIAVVAVRSAQPTAAPTGPRDCGEAIDIAKSLLDGAEGSAFRQR